MSQVDLSYLADKWPSEIVTRTDAPKLSGGAVSSKYLANLDSQGKGPPNRFKIGRKTCYPLKGFIRWLEDRAQIVEKKKL